MTPGVLLALGIAVVVGGGLIGFFRLLDRVGDKGRQEARAAALAAAVQVDGVEREVPIFRRHSKRFSHVERQSCTRYSIRRQRQGSELWSFLQRDEKSGAQYPNGWLYQSRDGSPSPGLHAILVQIAAEWKEEFLEFEADSGMISAYWDEWGGADLAKRIVTWLHELDNRSAAA